MMFLALLRSFTQRGPTRTAIACGAVAVGALLSTGCATHNVEAQWADPQFTGRSLAGQKVFVVCQAYDLAVRRVCAEQMASELTAYGATPVLAPDSGEMGGSTRPPADNFIPAARQAGAAAILRTAVSQDMSVPGSGPSVGVGIGGFGGSWGRGGGVGVGVQVPIGGSAAVSTSYTANGALTDVSSGRLMWTAKATTSPSNDVNEQMAALAKRVLEAARKAGLF